MSRPAAIILGAGMGGTAVAHRLSGTHAVIVVDREQERAATLGAAVSGRGVAVDLLDPVAVARFRDAVLAEHDRIDTVVHLVGGWQGSPSVDEKALEAWQAVSPGVLGTLQVASAIFREPLANAGGTFVMVSSTSVDRPTAGNVAYATAKAAAETWMGGLADAFSDTKARAVIVAVMALVDERMRAAAPDKPFRGYTDAAALADAIAGILSGASAPNGARIDLTKG